MPRRHLDANISLVLDKRDLVKLRTIARREDKSVSAVVREAIEEIINRKVTKK